MQWSDSVKSEAREVLVPEYTSSDESEFSEDDGDVAVSRYRVKHLPWETTRLANLKKDLDRVHISGLSKRNKMARLPRVRQNVIGSSRPVPDDPIVWAASVIKLEATDGGHEWHDCRALCHRLNRHYQYSVFNFLWPNSNQAKQT